MQCVAVRTLDPRGLSGLLTTRLRKHRVFMAYAPDCWRAMHFHGPVVGLAGLAALFTCQVPVRRLTRARSKADTFDPSSVHLAIG